MSAPVLGVIPARLGSSRLARKPLVRLANRPMIEWVWRRVRATALFDRLLIATDSEEVAATARAFGAHVELTDAAHPSGTDRIAEVVRRDGYGSFDVIVNIQGDEPFVHDDHLAAAIRLVGTDGWPIGTVAAPIATLEEWRDPAVVKVVRGDDGGALLFSRAAIPHVRGAEPARQDLEEGRLFLRHVGIYAYQRNALLQWVELPEGRLEQIERLEQLRPLAAGLRIGVDVVGAAEGGVDTPADAERAERRLQEHLSSGSMTFE